MPSKNTRKGSGRKVYRGQSSRPDNPVNAKARRITATGVGNSAPVNAAPFSPPAPTPVSDTIAMSASPAFAPAGGLPMPSGEATLPITAAGRQRKPWTFWRIVRWLMALLGVVVLLLIGYGTYLVFKVQGAIYVPPPPTTTPLPVVIPTQPTALPGQPTPTMLPTATPDHVRELPIGRFNILILGTDKRPNDTDHTPRSDTILLANVDTISHTVRLMSIPRDLIVKIPGYGTNKINAAYVFGEYYKEPGGGPGLAVQTVSDLFNVPIDYYVTINFDGFRAIVDAVGGVAIDVPYDITDDAYPDDDEGDPNGTITVHFDAGWQLMDGKTALRYARTRHADNDFARSKRQLQVIMAIRQKALSLDLLPSIPNIIDQLGGLVQTDIPFDQQLGLAQLGFNMSASDIITSSIDASMITAAYLDDGSEGLKLDEELAQPMLDTFFGWDSDTPTPTPSPRKTATRTPTPRHATPTRTPAGKK